MNPLTDSRPKESVIRASEARLECLAALRKLLLRLVLVQLSCPHDAVYNHLRGVDGGALPANRLPHRIGPQFKARPIGGCAIG